MASRDRISKWFDRGVKENFTHLIVVTDTFEYSDYPVYVEEGSDVRKMVESVDAKSMQKVTEVYHLASDRDQQLDQSRAYNIDPV